MPNVGINGLPKAVPLNDGLGVTVAEARKQRNDPKGLLDLEPGRPGLDAFENCLSALVTLTQPRAALRGCTAWLDDKASGALFFGRRSEPPPPAWAKPMPAPTGNWRCRRRRRQQQASTDKRSIRPPTSSACFLRTGETPNVGFKRTAQRVRLKDGLGQQRKSARLTARRNEMLWRPAPEARSGRKTNLTPTAWLNALANPKPCRASQQPCPRDSAERKRLKSD